MIRESKSPTLVREMLIAYLPEKHREARAGAGAGLGKLDAAAEMPHGAA